MSDTLFEKLSKVNVNEKTEKKGKFTYLSWAFAWAELKKVAPNAKVIVYHDENSNMPYFSSSAGVIVKVGVEVDGLQHISYLPVMDFKNKAMKAEEVDMMDVNKAIQRATVKAIGLHGLGLYIYAGEDLPEDEKDDKPAKPSARKSKKEAPKEEKKSSRRAKKDESKEEKPAEKEESKGSEDAPKSGGSFRRRRRS